MYAIIKKFNYKDVIVIALISTIYICGFVGRIEILDEIIDIQEHELGMSSGRDIETVAGTRKI